MVRAMMRRDPFAELGDKFRAMHSPARVARAEAMALLLQAVELHGAAGLFRRKAEDGVALAVAELARCNEKESEWRAIVHGLAVGLATELDKLPPSPPTESLAGVLRDGDFPDRVDRTKPRPKLRRVGLLRRALERRSTLRLLRRLSRGAVASAIEDATRDPPI